MASIQEIWNKYKLGKADLNEKRKLIKAIDDEDAQLEDILHTNWKKQKALKVSSKEKNKAWNRLTDSTTIKKQKVIKLYKYGIAASLAILVASAMLIYSSLYTTIEVHVASGEKIKEVILPDGSKVWINNASSISYPKRFDSDSRNLVLEGNAFFEVKKNPAKPFIVQTDGLSVKVLGTSFDVYNFKGESSTVSVKSGKVEVAHSDSNSKIVLVKNEQSKYDLGLNKLVKTTFDSEWIMAWKNDTLHFENLELGNAIKQIERKYGVRIICADPKLLETRIRASYKSEPLDTILNDLAFMTNFNFNIDTKKNEITLKPIPMDKN
ncbi:FecR domain-containing protein [Flagellimonas sp. 389]|uniref:FecR family protein n=1 Tax=Flagellimonas sp. 389 TaxID=2835862 RepID=UPI001BD424C3|nr:FecR domain-containing protein [Flagellimonas sp. 389]MBS9461070.1 FecR domain-containing protein [Flagellimonas sp. 389]